VLTPADKAARPVCEQTTASHEIIPQRGSARLVRDGEPASLLNPAHYPVEAVCAACGQQVRCDRWLRASWYHTDPG
jgi:hypothetical protein